MPNMDILAQKPYAVPRRGMGKIYYTLLRKREDPEYWQNYLDWLSEKATWDPAYIDDLAEAMVLPHDQLHKIFPADPYEEVPAWK